MGGLELVRDKKTKAPPLVPYGSSGKATVMTKEISRRLKAKGLFAVVRWSVVLVTPPLNITEDQLRQGLAIIDEVLDFVDTQTDQ